MKIVFFGSSQFAVPSLEALFAGSHEVVCVVTQPDRQKGRHLKYCCTPVKEKSLCFKKQIYQPESVNSNEAFGLLKGLGADLFIVISYGQILSARILQAAKIFSLNIHASLLPKYRGAAPISWALINGDRLTGVTSMKMVERMDAGPIIFQESLTISGSDTAATLEQRLSSCGAGVLLRTLQAIEEGKVTFAPQAEEQATMAPKLKKQDGLINWDLSAQEILNRIRGCFPWPGAFTYYKGKLLKIYSARTIGSLSAGRGDARPGEIIGFTRDGIIVSTGSECLIINELQLEGARTMAVQDFISGHRIEKGDSFKKSLK